MSKVRSALGKVVNFDLLAIKQQMANAPEPKSVNERRRFIDEKDGVRVKKVILAKIDNQPTIKTK